MEKSNNPSSTTPPVSWDRHNVPIAEKPPLWSVRRDPNHPETEVAAFHREYDLVQYMMVSCTRDDGTDVLFVLRHDRRKNIYKIKQRYFGRPPPLVIDHEPIGVSVQTGGEQGLLPGTKEAAE